MTRHKEQNNGFRPVISSFLHSIRFAIVFGLLIIIFLGLSCVSLKYDSPRKTISLDQSWRFHLGGSGPLLNFNWWKFE
jgi:hypothetical protein